MMSVIVEQFISHKNQSAAIEAQRAELEAQRHAAAEIEDWDTYDALEAQIEELSNQNMDHLHAMTKIVSQFTDADKAEFRASR